MAEKDNTTFVSDEKTADNITIPLEALDKTFDFKDRFAHLDFKSLLYKGYVRSGEIKVLSELSFECRTLLMEELIKCAEASAKYSSLDARQKAYMVEYLMYSIITINSTPLIMDMHEIQIFKDKNKREPTLEEQARWVLLNKIPPFILEFLYLICVKFKTDFDEVFLKEIDKQLQEVLNARNTILGQTTAVGT